MMIAQTPENHPMGFTMHRIFDPGGGDAAERELFPDLDHIFEIDGEIVSGGRLCQTIRISAGGRVYYVKRYRAEGKHRWKAFGRSRPLAEYRNLAYFEQLGIPVPRVVAYGTERTLGLFRRGTIVTEAVPQATDLQTLVRTQPDLFLDRTWMFQVLRLLAGYVRRLHDDGFTHGDLKWRNILATTTETPRVYLIDCPSGSRKLPPRHKHFVIKDLASLDKMAARHLSRTTRLRFYLWYSNQTRLTPKDKRLIAKVLTHGG